MSDSKKKKRTSKKKKEEHEKKFVCNYEGCGKDYLSQPALYTHKKNKHKTQEKDVKPNNRGRPRVIYEKMREKPKISLYRN